MGVTYLVIKTTCVDKGKPLRKGSFFFTRRTLFPPLDKKNTCDKVKGLCSTLERHIEELGVRYLSTLNRGQDSRQQPHERALGIAGARTPSPKVFKATSTKSRS